MVNIREASFDDFKGIQALEARYGMEPKETEAWQHLWKDNPAISESKQPWPIGWVIEDDNKKVVGYYGSIPMAYDLGGRRIFAAAGSSFVVDLAHRKHSISLAKNFFRQKYADILMMAIPNYEAGKVYSAYFKAKKVPVEGCDTVFFWVVNYGKFISSSLAKRDLPGRRAIAPFLSLIAEGSDLLLKRNKRIGEKGAAVSPQAFFDKRFDTFWEKLRKRYPDRLLYVRNSKNLGWHFKYPLADRTAWLYIVEDSDREINAYAVFLRQDNPDIGLKRARLVDLQSIDDDPEIFTSLISAGVKRCREEDVHVLEAMGFGSEKRGILERYAHHKRRLPNYPFYYRTKDESLAGKLTGPGVWDWCLLDGDASL